MIISTKGNITGSVDGDVFKQKKTKNKNKKTKHQEKHPDFSLHSPYVG